MINKEKIKLNFAFFEKDINLKTNKKQKKELKNEITKLVISFLISFLVIGLYFLSNNLNSEFFSKLYLYTIGLLFGDLIIFLVIALLSYFLLNFLNLFLNKYAISWFDKYQKISYSSLKNNLFKNILVLLLIFILIYHAILVGQRTESWYYYKTSELSSIFSLGWYKSFTNDGINPITKGNIGILFDSIFNIFYVISFSPFLVWIIIIFLSIYLYFSFWLIRPYQYWKKLRKSKHSVVEYETELKKNQIFFYTNETKRFFEFINWSKKILNLENESFKQTYSEIKKHFSILTRENEAFLYFKNIKKTKKPINAEIENKENEITLTEDETEELESAILTNNKTSISKNVQIEKIENPIFYNEEINELNFDENLEETIEVSNLNETKKINSNLSKNEPATNNEEEWESPIL
ncbi:hypothetical protein [Mycoplasmopsis gallinarum]|uniref:Uncharacterized protein n=1 Tax=Mycoplasmopsis gallinarum TaxID=29557 RepID=A0A168RQ80_9BACT|nr:hypothetical protein [Mycoplasmopsis gallinarum]OAB49186.1 hypothetical protein MGALLINA_00630 [Mycoplasmopsis gallinarum]